MIRVNTDAAFNPKTNQAGMGILISGDGLYEQLAVPLTDTKNNHTAEFEALIYGLYWLISQELTESMVFLRTDSRVVTQVIENKHTKNQDYQPFLEEILALKKVFNLIYFEWIPENQNKGADNLAKQALMKNK